MEGEIRTAAKINEASEIQLEGGHANFDLFHLEIEIAKLRQMELQTKCLTQIADMLEFIEQKIK